MESTPSTEARASAVADLTQQVTQDVLKLGFGEDDISRIALERHVESFVGSVIEAAPYVAVSRPISLVIAVASEGIEADPVLLLPLGVLESPARRGAASHLGPRTYRYIPREAINAT